MIDDYTSRMNGAMAETRMAAAKSAAGTRKLKFLSGSIRPRRERMKTCIAKRMMLFTSTRKNSSSDGRDCHPPKASARTVSGIATAQNQQLKMK
jgi:hypothetical protein